MKAKALKKVIYGNKSSNRKSRKYIITHPAKPVPRFGMSTLYPVGTLANHPDSLRAKYQKAKRNRQMA